MSFREAPVNAPKIALAVQHDAACPSCGYNLRGLRMDRRCPECGHALSELFARPIAMATGDLAERMVNLPIRLALITMAVAWLERGMVVLLPGITPPQQSMVGGTLLAMTTLLALPLLLSVLRHRGEVEDHPAALPLDRAMPMWLGCMVLGLVGLTGTGVLVFVPLAAKGFATAAILLGCVATIVGGRAIVRLMGQHAIQGPAAAPWLAGLALLMHIPAAVVPAQHAMMLPIQMIVATLAISFTAL
ncbi:MAG: hypothetical protein AAGK78_06115, partial [Planctomycetota bacterium]